MIFYVLKTHNNVTNKIYKFYLSIYKYETKEKKIIEINKDAFTGKYFLVSVFLVYGKVKI